MGRQKPYSHAQRVRSRLRSGKTVLLRRRLPSLVLAQLDESTIDDLRRRRRPMGIARYVVLFCSFERWELGIASIGLSTNGMIEVPG